MSETKTIEERYEKVKKNSEFYHSWVVALLDDLMAERGKKVNLDEIFPKEIMEKAKSFRLYYDGNDFFWNTHPPEMTVVSWLEHVLKNKRPMSADVVFAAYSSFSPDAAQSVELARVCVRLGLTVEIIEKGAPNVD